MERRSNNETGNSERNCETPKASIKVRLGSSKISIISFIVKMTNSIFDKAFSVVIKDNLVLVLINDFVK